MFDHYPYIAVQHHVALASCIRQHSVVSGATAPLFAKLYKLAQDGLAKPANEPGFLASVLVTTEVTVSTVTDAKTGLYIQLARVQSQTSTYLTVGQKWAMEQLSPQHGNVATTLW